MNDLSIIQYNLYYLLRSLNTGHDVIILTGDPDKINNDTMFLYRMTLENEPLQLGGGFTRSLSFNIDVLTSNGVIHNDTVSKILDRFYDSTLTLLDYSPISGESNFPYNPANSSVVNVNFSQVLYGSLEFTDIEANDLWEEKIDNIQYYRSAIRFIVKYVKE